MPLCALSRKDWLGVYSSLGALCGVQQHSQVFTERVKEKCGQVPKCGPLGFGLRYMLLFICCKNFIC